MIKDKNVIKDLLKEHVEVELPYPFKEGVMIKYFTMKDGEQFFSTGGRFVRMLNKKILLQNSGKSWTVPVDICDKKGDIIYKSRFFVHKDFEKENDKKINELESIIKSQQDIIKKLSQQVKIKAEENDKLKLFIKHKLNR
jgi:uncharacterized coiled-coil protein SlyX